MIRSFYIAGTLAYAHVLAFALDHVLASHVPAVPQTTRSGTFRSRGRPRGQPTRALALPVVYRAGLRPAFTYTFNIHIFITIFIHIDSFIQFFSLFYPS